MTTETTSKKKKQDTKLESEGVEFIVLGHLLVEGVSAYKAYINFPGYNLTAVNPGTKKVARIQVKSRWATDYDTYPKVAVQWLNQALWFYQSLCLVDSEVLLTRHLRGSRKTLAIILGRLRT